MLHLVLNTFDNKKFSMFKLSKEKYPVVELRCELQIFFFTDCAITFATIDFLKPFFFLTLFNLVSLFVAEH